MEMLNISIDIFISKRIEKHLLVELGTNYDF